MKLDLTLDWKGFIICLIAAVFIIGSFFYDEETLCKLKIPSNATTRYWKGSIECEEAAEKYMKKQKHAKAEYYLTKAYTTYQELCADKKYRNGQVYVHQACSHIERTQKKIEELKQLQKTK